MNRSRTDERKVDNYRTVTEIVDAESSYQREFELGDLIYKNETYLRRVSRRELYLMVGKYIAMVRELNLPDLRVLFSSSTTVDKLFTLVYYSLAFVNNQMVPHQTQFVDMRFVEVLDRKLAIPTEPIVFYKSINSEDQTITCYVDRPGILRILEKPVDVDLKFEPDEPRSEMFKAIDRIRSVERRQPQACVNNVLYMQEPAPKMDETYVTPFVALLILFSQAYLGLFRLMRSDFQQYLNFLLNHESLVKEKSLSNITNTIVGHFNFRVDAGGTEKRSGGGLVFK